ncbi:hypothetical protein A5671_09150 [Mycolicibacter heraklionensis]|nr:hypothetical protein A5671_09150 [Mycolicibacter heraklionensis]
MPTGDLARGGIQRHLGQQFARRRLADCPEIARVVGPACFRLRDVVRVGLTEVGQGHTVVYTIVGPWYPQIPRAGVDLDSFYESDSSSSLALCIVVGRSMSVT